MYFISGENIYQVTQNGRILENSSNHQQGERDNEQDTNKINELELFANELLGERKLSTDNTFKLTLGNENANRASNKEIVFDSIDVNVGKLEDLMGDISLKNVNDTCFKDDLLDLIGED